MKDIRWKQRFTNLEKAFGKLSIAVKHFNLNDLLLLKEQGNDEELAKLELIKEGVIQRFEYCYELFVNTLRDLLIWEGEPEENVNGSRKVLKQAFSKGYITNHDEWRNMIISRNETSHTYNEETANHVTQKILSDYYPLMKELFDKLKNEL